MSAKKEAWLRLIYGGGELRSRLIDHETIDALYKHVTSVYERQLTDFLHPPLHDYRPDKTALDQMCNVAISASLLRNEGRFCEAAIHLTVVDESEYEYYYPDTLDDGLRFLEGVRLTARTMAMLGPAAVWPSHALDVRQVDNLLEIVGIVPVSGGVVRASAPGRIVIGGVFKSDAVAVISLDEILLFTGDNDEVRRHLARPFRYSDGDVTRFVNATVTLILEILLIGHGGAVLIANMPWTGRPDGIAEWVGVDDLSGRLPLENRQDDYSFRGGDRLSTACLKRTARLAAVDGAIVLNSEFEVIGFGAKIQTLDVTAEAISCFDVGVAGSPTSVLLRDVGGTRHRSAIAFVQAHPHCAAFVCSSDGHASFIHVDESGTLTMVRHLERLRL